MGAQTKRGRPSSQALEVVAAGLSHRGRVRDHNEDALALLPEQGLFIVADGMGGHQAGETASKAVVTVLPKMIEQQRAAAAKGDLPSLSRTLRDAIAELSRLLRQQSAEQTGLAGMGSTVVLACIRGDAAVIAHMGDSRAYLLRRGKLKQLTDDHSLVGILLRQGEITPAEARVHPARSRISRYVGMQGDAQPEARTLKLLRGDRLLLCTDGLTGMVEDEAIASILTAESDPEAACAALIDAANKSGGNDNITAIILDWNRARPQ